MGIRPPPHDDARGRMMPPGPCIVCGENNYPLSMGGPTICPACDCGIDPDLTKLRRKLAQVENELIQARDERNEFYNATGTLKGRLARVERERDEARSVQISVLRSFDYIAAGLRNGMWNQELRAELLKEVDRFDNSLLTTAKQVIATAQARIRELEDYIKYGGQRI